MAMKLNATLRVVVAVSAVFSSIAVIGCGAGSSDKPQSIASPERVTQIVEMRKIFDDAKGDWNSVAPDKKTKYNELAGSEAKGKEMWDNMLHPGPKIPAFGGTPNK